MRAAAVNNEATGKLEAGHGHRMGVLSPSGAITRAYTHMFNSKAAR